MMAVALSLETPLWTAEQVGERLGIPPSSIYDYARRRDDPIPHMRIGRHIRFHKSAVEGWLARQTHGRWAA